MIDMGNICEHAGSASAHLDYDHYNREERYLCSHLFRLLHEPKDDYAVLRKFTGGVPEITDFRIFAEVALIRDAYHVRKANPFDYMDSIVRMVAGQEQVTDYRSYSGLPEELRTPHLTHPRQILQKGGDILTADEKKIYGSLQGMFNAKPDLAICCGQELFVYEAKWTLGFDSEQLRRTENIAAIWAKLLYRDLGFSAEPVVKVKKLGLEKFKPDVSWEALYVIACDVYPESDRSRQALTQAIIN